MRFFSFLILISLIALPTCAENISMTDLVGQWHGVSKSVSGRHWFDFYDNGYIIEHSKFYLDIENKKPRIGVDVSIYRPIGTTAKTVDILVLRDVMNNPHAYVYSIHKGGKAPWLGPDEIGIKIYTCTITPTAFLSANQYSIQTLKNNDMCNFSSSDYATYSRKK